jgi:hypothetical protein
MQAYTLAYLPVGFVMPLPASAGCLEIVRALSWQILLGVLAKGSWNLVSWTAGGLILFIVSQFFGWENDLKSFQLVDPAAGLQSDLSCINSTVKNTLT